jgi:hypothetical protein
MVLAGALHLSKTVTDFFLYILKEMCYNARSPFYMQMKEADCNACA